MWVFFFWGGGGGVCVVARSLHENLKYLVKYHHASSHFLNNHSCLWHKWRVMHGTLMLKVRGLFK